MFPNACFSTTVFSLLVTLVAETGLRLSCFACFMTRRLLRWSRALPELLLCMILYLCMYCAFRGRFVRISISRASIPLLSYNEATSPARPFLAIIIRHSQRLAPIHSSILPPLDALLKRALVAARSGLSQTKSPSPPPFLSLRGFAFPIDHGGFSSSSSSGSSFYLIFCPFFSSSFLVWGFLFGWFLCCWR